MENEAITVEIDWAFGDDGDLEGFRRQLAAITAQYPVEAKIVVDRGPAGGWPVVAVSGPRRQVRGFLLAEYLDGSVDPLNGIVGLIADYDGRL